MTNGLMKRAGAALAALFAAAPSPTRAAELTRIVSSFEEGHSFGFSLDAIYQFTQERTKTL